MLRYSYQSHRQARQHPTLLASAEGLVVLFKVRAPTSIPSALIDSAATPQARAYVMPQMSKRMLEHTEAQAKRQPRTSVEREAPGWYAAMAGTGAPSSRKPEAGILSPSCAPCDLDASIATHDLPSVTPTRTRKTQICERCQKPQTSQMARHLKTCGVPVEERQKVTTCNHTCTCISYTCTCITCTCMTCTCT